MILFNSESINEKRYIRFKDCRDLKFQKHTHYAFEIVCVNNGELFCEINNTEYTLRKGDAILILPGEIHSYDTHITKHNNCTVFIFTNDLIDVFYEEIKGKKLSHPVFSTGKEFSDVLKSDCDIFMKKSLLYMACSMTYSNSELLDVEESSFYLENLIAFYVQNNYAKDITLKKLALENGYNYTYLSAFFSTNFKQNFASYVNKFRLQYAAYLLETTDMEIADIVNESGFSTTRNFHIAFNNYYNVSPKKYRITSRKKD